METHDGGWTNSGVCITGSLAQDASITIDVGTNKGTIAKNCPTLKELRLPNLQSNKYRAIISCNNLKSVYVPNLTEMDCVGGSDNQGYILESCDSVETLRIPKLYRYSSDSYYVFMIYGCNNLEKIDMGNLSEIILYSDYHSCVFGYLPKLRFLKMGRITMLRDKLNYNKGVAICSFPTCFNHLEFDEDTMVTPYIRNSVGQGYWGTNQNQNTSITSNHLCEDSFCHNNMEQLLYNFRTYVINRLHNYTGGTKHNMTLSSNIFNILFGLDDTQYALTYNMPDEPDIDYVTSMNQKLSDINWGLTYI